MRRALLLSSLLLPVFAAEPPAPKPADGGAKPAETAKPPAPFLGVRFDENAVTIDAELGMPVSEIVRGSTVETLGLEAGDRLLSLNGKPMEKTGDVVAALAGAKVGDVVAVEYLRGGQKSTVKGPLQERPRPASLAGDVSRLNQKLAEVKELAEAKSREPTLGEILQQLRDIESGLPRAVAAFKKQYPDGEFDIRIQVTIVSDKHAKDPISFSNAQAAPAGAATDKKPDGKKADEKRPDDKPAPAVEPKK